MKPGTIVRLRGGYYGGKRLWRFLRQSADGLTQCYHEIDRVGKSAMLGQQITIRTHSHTVVRCRESTLKRKLG
jgi:hypothetical protein